MPNKMNRSTLKTFAQFQFVLRVHAISTSIQQQLFPFPTSIVTDNHHRLPSPCRTTYKEDDRTPTKTQGAAGRRSSRNRFRQLQPCFQLPSPSNRHRCLQGRRYFRQTGVATPSRRASSTSTSMHRRSISSQFHLVA